jgi:hypothetical protein
MTGATDYRKMAKCKHEKLVEGEGEEIGRLLCEACGLIKACATTRGLSDQLRQCYGMALFGDDDE